jgi:UrcA family protein
MTTLPKTSGFAVTMLAAASLFAIFPASAAGASAGTRSVAVRYAHLDLGNAAAQQALHRELAVAAERACGAYEARNLRDRSDWRRCRDAAFDEAVARIDDPRIAALHENAGKPIPVAVSAAN